jgi:hypothetical protein
MAQTSDRISALAARYASMTNTQFRHAAKSEADMAELAHDVRSMAASLLRQDEVKGPRMWVKKLLGV